MKFPIDHDLHCHSHLSFCSRNEQQTIENILAFAKEHGYTVQCITDHFWDSLVPGPSDWYAQQDYEHVRQSLPLPKDDQVRLIFGCETEFCGGEKLGLHPKNYDKFDFIVIPPNHFHMKDFVRPSCYDTEEKIAELLVERLEQISEFDLPWHKVGIAHMTAGLIFLEGDECKVYRHVDEARFRSVMRKFASRGTGIEINCACFNPGWREHEDDHLRLYRLAKEEGCKFYLASDAHRPYELCCIPDHAPELIELLGLTAEHLFRIP